MTDADGNQQIVREPNGSRVTAVYNADNRRIQKDT
jgi:hypothetical protein